MPIAPPKAIDAIVEEHERMQRLVMGQSELAMSLDEPRQMNHQNLRMATAAVLRDSTEKLNTALMALVVPDDEDEA